MTTRYFVNAQFGSQSAVELPSMGFLCIDLVGTIIAMLGNLVPVLLPHKSMEQPCTMPAPRQPH